MSLNRVQLIDSERLADLYVNHKRSSSDISNITGLSKSTTRLQLIRCGVKLRTPSEAIKLCPEKLGHKGKRRPLSEEQKRKISLGRLRSDKFKGVRLNKHGYFEITRGSNKGRSVHDVIMEIHIGRRLYAHEVVHHKNAIRTDNHIDNLELLTRSGHAKFHSNGVALLKYREANGYDSGHQSPRSKLTKEDVLTIRSGAHTTKELSDMIGVSASCIKKARSNKTYKY